MPQFFRHLSYLCLVLMSSLLLACGGSSNKSNNTDNGTPNPDPEPPAPTAQVITGTAATGAAINGFVYLTDRNGQPGDAVAYDIDANGNFEIDVADRIAPFMLKAVPSNGSAAQFSYAAQAGVTNITPLTTLALFEATQRADISALFNNWAASFASIDVQALQQTAQSIAASLQAQFAANGVNTQNFDFFTTPFAANNAGFDAVLDATSVAIDLAGGTVTVNGNTFEIPTDLPEIPDVPGGNDWNLVISGEVNGFAIPQTSVSGVPAPSQVDVESQFNGQLSSEIPGLQCASVAVNSVTNTDTRVVFTLTASCTVTQAGFSVPYSYNLTYTYTR